LILSYFVPKGEPTAIVSSGTRDTDYVSLGFETINPNNYNYIVLQNSGSASASEILVGTLKDYFPETVII
jgi:C-terminal processing protease CtpA/Prc